MICVKLMLRRKSLFSLSLLHFPINSFFSRTALGLITSVMVAVTLK